MLPLLFLTIVAQAAPPVVPLWPNGAPGSEARRNEAETAPNPWSIGNIQNPSLTVYVPPKEIATGAAVIIAPGGGHRELVVGEEGRKPAEYLSRLGVTCFVLKYRLAREPGSSLTVQKDTRADAYRAVRLVRARSTDWGIDPKRVGMLGFSAGGEVVSMAALGDGRPEPAAADPIDRHDPRPDFAMWVYPGPLGMPETLPADAPPAFLLVSNDDGSANVVLELARRYRVAKRPVEVHVLASGGHGFNMGDRSKLAAVKSWPQRMADWLADSGLLTKR